jgi:tetratricopeptide (TPR) repeat protein
MDDGKSAALPHRRLGVTRTANAVKSWNEQDVRGTELRSVSMHFGVEAARFELLLGPLLRVDCARLQVQPLLEQAWTRLQNVRETIVDAQMRISDGAAKTSIEQAQTALQSCAAETLALVEQSLEAAFQACQVRNSAEHSSADAASVRALQASLAAVRFDFPGAIALGNEAVALAGADSPASWHYQVQHAEFLLDQGREFNDAESLQALAQLCEVILLPIATASRGAADQAWVHDCLGQALGMLGRAHSGTALLDSSVKAFEAALALRDQASSPYDWAATQNHLGNAVGSLGQRQHDLELLDRAAGAFEAALEVPISNVAPEGRASAQSNLAAVLQTIGQQRQDAATIERAISAYQSALSIWTPDRKPLFWAATQSNLGAALRVVGGMREDASVLEQSVAAYRSALTARSRARMPSEWARTQNDLGAALQALAELTEDTLGFGRAIAAYRDALREISREGEPMTWALTTANIGVARRKLAEYTSDVEVSRRALADIKMALDVFRGANHAPLTDLGLEQLAIAMEVNAELEAPSQD